MSYKVALDQGKTYRNRHWNQYFILGLVPVHDTYNFDELCPIGTLSRLDSRIEGGNVLTSLFSFGLSNATTVSAQCLAKDNISK